MTSGVLSASAISGNIALARCPGDFSFTGPPSSKIASVKPALFDRHLEWIKANCQVVPFAKIYDAAASQNGEMPVVAVTFDEPAPAGSYPTPTPSPTPTPVPGASPAPPAPPPPPPPSTARFLPRVEGGVFQFVLVSTVNVAYDLRGDADQIEELIRLPRLPDSLRSDVRLGDGVIVVEAVGRDVEMNVGEAQR